MVTETIDILGNLQGNLEKKLDRINNKLGTTEKRAILAQKRLVGLSKTSKPLDQIKETFKKANTQVRVLKKEAAMVKKKLDAVEDSAAQARVPLGRLGTALNFKKTKEGLIDFNGDMLSLMFLGMALRGVFEGALRSIFDGYKKIIPENDKFNREMTKLTANFEFFKFQLAQTLASSELFTILTGSVNGLLKILQGLSPQMKQFIIVGLGIGAIVSIFLMWLGMMALGIASIKNLGITAKGSFAQVYDNFKPILKGFRQLALLVKNFSLSKVVASLKAFGQGGFSSVGQFFKNIIANVGKFLKTTFSGGFIKGVKGLFKALRVGSLAQFTKVIKGFTSFFKLTPLGWIIVAIQSIFEVFESVGNRTFKSTTAKVVGIIVSLIINVIENVIQAFADLFDLIVNVITSAIEFAAGALGFNLEIPSLDLGGMVDRLGDELENLALDLISERKEEPSAQSTTETTTNNVYYIGDVTAAEATADLAEQEFGGDILAPLPR